MRIKIPPILFFLSILGLSLLSLIAAFALTWSGKDSGNAFLVASSFFALVATNATAGGSTMIALARLIKSS